MRQRWAANAGPRIELVFRLEIIEGSPCQSKLLGSWHKASISDSRAPGKGASCEDRFCCAQRCLFTSKKNGALNSDNLPKKCSYSSEYDRCATQKFQDFLVQTWSVAKLEGSNVSRAMMVDRMAHLMCANWKCLSMKVTVVLGGKNVRHHLSSCSSWPAQMFSWRGGKLSWPQNLVYQVRTPRPRMTVASFTFKQDVANNFFRGVSGVPDVTSYGADLCEWLVRHGSCKHWQAT